MDASVASAELSTENDTEERNPNCVCDSITQAELPEASSSGFNFLAKQARKVIIQTSLQAMTPSDLVLGIIVFAGNEV